MPDNFAAALSAEMRRALKQEINTLSDAAMVEFKQNDRENYNDFMDLVNDLLAFENEHGAKIYEDSFDEQVVVTPKASPRDTIYDAEYNGRPMSTMFDSMKETKADALVKTAWRARFTPTATTFSFDNPATFNHRPESEYRSDWTYNRAPDCQPLYGAGRWSSDWENAPTPEPSPKFSPVSSADTTPRTKEFMLTLEARWDLATANAKENRPKDATWPMDDYGETAKRRQDDAERAAAKQAKREIKDKSKPFMDFMDSLPDPAEKGNHTFDDSAPTWSFDPLDDDASSYVSVDLDEQDSEALTKSSHTSQDESGDSTESITEVPIRDRPVDDRSFKDFLELNDDLADGMGHLHISEYVPADAVPARIHVIEEPPRTLRRVTRKIGPC